MCVWDAGADDGRGGGVFVPVDVDIVDGPLQINQCVGNTVYIYFFVFIFHEHKPNTLKKYIFINIFDAFNAFLSL